MDQVLINFLEKSFFFLQLDDIFVFALSTDFEFLVENVKYE